MNKRRPGVTHKQIGVIPRTKEGQVAKQLHAVKKMMKRQQLSQISISPIPSFGLQTEWRKKNKQTLAIYPPSFTH